MWVLLEFVVDETIWVLPESAVGEKTWASPEFEVNAKIWVSLALVVVVKKVMNLKTTRTMKLTYFLISCHILMIEKSRMS
jgi:hypothetical protein